VTATELVAGIPRRPGRALADPWCSSRWCSPSPSHSRPWARSCDSSPRAPEHRALDTPPVRRRRRAALHGRGRHSHMAGAPGWDSVRSGREPGRPRGTGVRGRTPRHRRGVVPRQPRPFRERGKGHARPLGSPSTARRPGAVSVRAEPDDLGGSDRAVRGGGAVAVAPSLPLGTRVSRTQRGLHPAARGAAAGSAACTSIGCWVAGSAKTYPSPKAKASPPFAPGQWEPPPSRWRCSPRRA
jgi:hypothetical protein